MSTSFEYLPGLWLSMFLSYLGVVKISTSALSPSARLTRTGHSRASCNSFTFSRSSAFSFGAPSDVIITHMSRIFFEERSILLSTHQMLIKPTTHRWASSSYTRVARYINRFRRYIMTHALCVGYQPRRLGYAN